MFPNEVVVGTMVTSAADLSLSLTDTDNGRSVRRLNVSSTEYLELKISRALSQENGVDVPTNRILVRLDRGIFDSTLAKPRWVTQSAYMVIAQPSHSSYDVASMKLLVRRLISVFAQGQVAQEDHGPLLNSYASGLTDTTVNRLLTGEV